MTKHERIEFFERRANKAYRELFDSLTPSDATARYNETKDALFGGLRIAYEVRDPAALVRLARSLWAVRAVFRTQFP
jgi:hypothetical protein